MDELNRALQDISSIRRQLAHTTKFRGLGPATLSATALFAVLGALAQAAWISDPAAHLLQYLLVWAATAAGVLLLSGYQIYTRARRLHSGMSDEMMHQAVEQFLPALGAGSLVTLVLLRAAPISGWMLPGLWQILFSLGIFASCRFLPRAMPLAAFWYLLAGLATLALGDGRALAPWVMGAAFGGGQLMIAAVLLCARYEVEDER